MKDVLKVWPMILNKEEIKGVKETYFFNFIDNKEESCALEINNGICQFIDGEPKEYTIKISTETNEWLAYFSKQKELGDAKIIIEGDDKKLEKFQKYFSGQPKGYQIKNNNGYAITENEKEILEGRWTQPKKVLILNGSPRKDRGATAMIYSAFKQGLDECKCEVDIVHVADLENKPCNGCFTCWGKTKKCVHNDDINELHHKLHTYDLLVLAAPVYVDGLPGALKNLIDRSILVMNPEFLVKDDHCRHAARYPKMPHLVLLSTCGFTEMDNFTPMIEHVQKICKNMHLTYVGEVLPPTAWMLSIPNIRPLYKNIVEAIKQAGIELVKNGKIPKEIQKQIENPIFTRGQITAIYNSGN